MTILETRTSVDPLNFPVDGGLAVREPPRRSTWSRVGDATSTVGWALVGLAAFAFLWQFGASQVKDLPTPADTLTRLSTLVGDAFANNGPNDQGVGLLLKASLLRVFTGFAIAAAVGIPLGLAMGSSPRVWKAMNPLSQMLRPVSPLAFHWRGIRF